MGANISIHLRLLFSASEIYPPPKKIKRSLIYLLLLLFFEKEGREE
jgi:hypothetical protein